MRWQDIGVSLISNGLYEGLFVKIKKVLSMTILVQNMHIKLNSQIGMRQNAYFAQ